MAANSIVVSLLSQTDLFSGLAVDDLNACAAVFEKMHLAKGETLFVRGDPGTHLYLVETGRVRLSISTLNDRALSFRHAGPGELFGEIAALDGKPRTADASAITPVTVHGLERTRFRALWSDRPAVSTRVIAFLCARLRETTTQFEQVALLPLEVRLAQFLLSALGIQMAPPGRRVPLDLGFSQGELSQLLGASRPKVNAAMGMLEQAGAIKRTLDRIFCDPGKLDEIARRAIDA
jgi:CRP/FNR family transcriptional regulator, cyclic AMP receptor protein